METLVLSCDSYSSLWELFFHFYDKYYPDHPKTYLVTETKTCPYCETINVNSQVWSVRFRWALEKIKSDKVLVLLDDFFIRSRVDSKRIENLKFTDDIICYNFELEYRKPVLQLNEWDIQANNQVYLNSCQPTLWDRDKLKERLNGDFSPQEWETQRVDSPYIHFINSKDYIIDVGYRHQPLSEGWGITRGRLTLECINFLKNETVNYNALLQDFRLN